jgi:hypothetical protein
MQQTRLSTLFSSTASQFRRWVFNPWRRISLVIIGLLFGNFFGVEIAAVTGQLAEQDILIAAILVIFTEIISRLIYRRSPQYRGQPNNLLLELLNALKIGMTYSLFVEAFKLGS